jgi:hypothetical protein
LGGDTLIRSTLHDRHPAIRTEAARALLVVGEPQTVDQVFRSVLLESALMRVLLSSPLKRHARYLLANTIPSVLAESRSPQATNCLEILAVWKLAIPALAIGPLLGQHRDGIVLSILIALLPYVTTEDSIEGHLLSALDSTDLEVQCAAARATGQLKLSRLMPELVRLLNQNARLAFVSATALAQMGAAGEQLLERIIAGPDRKAAAAAMEALETLTVGTA